HKQIFAVAAWENSKKAAAEAKLEQLEKKKARYAKKMKNRVAQIHKEAGEKRAMVEAKRGEEILKAEEMAASASGLFPHSLFLPFVIIVSVGTSRFGPSSATLLESSVVPLFS
ncbi:Remorin 1.4, partial [Linum perenne]